MSYQNENNSIFIRNSKGTLAKIFFFFSKFIYNILCIIKKYIEFGNYSFSFKQTFLNPIFYTLQSKTLKNVLKKLIKLNKIRISK